MASVANCPYPLRSYEDIITENLTSLYVTGSTAISGSLFQIKGVEVIGYTGSSGSGAASTPIVGLGLQITITGSTYIIRLAAV